MADYHIGRVTAVAADSLEVQLDDFEIEGTVSRGVPVEMIVDVSTDSGPAPVTIGQPGTFILVALPAARLLCMVIEIDMREGKVPSSDVKEATAEGQTNLERVTRSLSVIPVGTLGPSGAFERGADVLPTVNAPAFAVSPTTLDEIYSSFAEGDFAIGDLSLVSGQRAKIHLDALLTRHAAVLGQTGGGKSWAVANLVQKLCKFEQPSIVLFDLHGEYASAFGSDADVISASDLEFPYWLMNSDELLGLMVDRSESAAPNQIAKFKDLLQAAKERPEENQKLGIKKITIDTPVYFDLNSILKEFERLDVEMVPGAGSKDKQGPLFGQFSRLLMRVSSRLNDRRYDMIFKPKLYASSASMEDLFRRLLGRSSNTKKVVVIDFSSMPFDVRSVTISLILRCLFDFAYWHRKVHGSRFPVSVLADEAHIYLNDTDTSSQAARSSAERIAKEGRKYGISLTVISQRPREVSSTILSQCGSFLCLRISNPDDQSYVRSLLPDSIRGITSMFASLRRGECILIGDSVMMPTRIRLDRPDPPPNSDDASFKTEWSKPLATVDFQSVLHAWRSQEVS